MNFVYVFFIFAVFSIPYIISQFDIAFLARVLFFYYFFFRILLVSLGKLYLFIFIQSKVILCYVHNSWDKTIKNGSMSKRTKAIFSISNEIHKRNGLASQTAFESPNSRNEQKQEREKKIRAKQIYDASFSFYSMCHTPYCLLYNYALFSNGEKSQQRQTQRGTNKREQKNGCPNLSCEGLCNSNSNVFCFIL